MFSVLRSENRRESCLRHLALVGVISMLFAALFSPPSYGGKTGDNTIARVNAESARFFGPNAEEEWAKAQRCVSEIGWIFEVMPDGRIEQRQQRRFALKFLPPLSRSVMAFTQPVLWPQQLWCPAFRANTGVWGRAEGSHSWDKLAGVPAIHVGELMIETDAQAKPTVIAINNKNSSFELTTSGRALTQSQLFPAKQRIVVFGGTPALEPEPATQPIDAKEMEEAELLGARIFKRYHRTFPARTDLGVESMQPGFFRVDRPVSTAKQVERQAAYMFTYYPTQEDVAYDSEMRDRIIGGLEEDEPFERLFSPVPAHDGRLSPLPASASADSAFITTTPPVSPVSSLDDDGEIARILGSKPTQDGLQTVESATLQRMSPSLRLSPISHNQPALRSPRRCVHNSDGAMPKSHKRAAKYSHFPLSPRGKIASLQHSPQPSRLGYSRSFGHDELDDHQNLVQSADTEDQPDLKSSEPEKGNCVEAHGAAVLPQRSGSLPNFPSFDLDQPSQAQPSQLIDLSDSGPPNCEKLVQEKHAEAKRPSLKRELGGPNDGCGRKKPRELEEDGSTDV